MRINPELDIPAEKQLHLFERFYRVEGDNQLTYPGLGLVLYIAAECLRRHQGSIWVESEPGTGTTMSFALPVLPAPAESNHEDQNRFSIPFREPRRPV